MDKSKRYDHTRLCGKNCLLRHHDLIVALNTMSNAGRPGVDRSNGPMVRKFRSEVTKCLNNGWSQGEAVPDPLISLRQPLVHTATILGKWKAIKCLSNMGFDLTVRESSTGDTPIHQLIRQLYPIWEKSTRAYYSSSNLSKFALNVLNCLFHEENSEHSTESRVIFILSLKNSNGETPLLLAASKFRKAISDEIAGGQSKERAFHRAILQRLIELLPRDQRSKELLTHRDNSGETVIGILKAAGEINSSSGSRALLSYVSRHFPEALDVELGEATSSLAKLKETSSEANVSGSTGTESPSGFDSPETSEETTNCISSNVSDKQTNEDGFCSTSLDTEREITWESNDVLSVSIGQFGVRSNGLLSSSYKPHSAQLFDSMGVPKLIPKVSCDVGAHNVDTKSLNNPLSAFTQSDGEKNQHLMEQLPWESTVQIVEVVSLRNFPRMLSSLSDPPTNDESILINCTCVEDSPPIVSEDHAPVTATANDLSEFDTPSKEAAHENLSKVSLPYTVELEPLDSTKRCGQHTQARGSSGGSLEDLPQNEGTSLMHHWMDGSSVVRNIQETQTYTNNIFEEDEDCVIVYERKGDPDVVRGENDLLDLLVRRTLHLSPKCKHAILEAIKEEYAEKLQEVEEKRRQMQHNKRERLQATLAKKQELENEMERLQKEIDSEEERTQMKLNKLAVKEIDLKRKISYVESNDCEVEKRSRSE